MKLLILSIFIALCIGGRHDEDDPIEVDVLILGAGLGGTELASLAASESKDFLVLEGRSTYGGRTQSIDIGGFKLPKGGGWQQGAGQNHALTKRIRECGIRVVKQNWNKWLDFGNDGAEISAPWSEFETSFACAEQLSLQLQNEGFDDFSQDTALKMCEWWAQTDGEFLVEDSTMRFEWAEGVDVSSTYNTLPWATYLSPHTDADYFFIDPRGAEEMAGCWLDRYLLNGGRDDPRILYNSTVVNINTDEKIVTVRDGARYRYNTLFNTIPLGVLRYNQVKEEGSLYTPPLSLNKKLALISYHTPVYQKIYFQFPEKFWDGNEFYNIASSFQHGCSLWQSVDLQNWLPGSAIIYLTCTSPASDYGETLSEEQWYEIGMTDLRKVFGDDIPDPTRIVVSKWLDDEHFRGTYSNRGLENAQERFYEFFSPQGYDGSLIHTGESYCRNQNGYIHSPIIAAETSWCEYKVSKGELPADTDCFTTATDADGDILPNVCFTSGYLKRSDGGNFNRYERINKGQNTNEKRSLEFDLHAQALFDKALDL